EIEKEVIIPIQTHHRRSIGKGDVAGKLVATAVEVLVPRVERNGKQASGGPFEALLALLVFLILPDRRCPAARNHIDGELVHVVLRLGLAPGLISTTWQSLAM